MICAIRPFDLDMTPLRYIDADDHNSRTSGTTRRQIDRTGAPLLSNSHPPPLLKNSGQRSATLASTGRPPTTVRATGLPPNA